ncbi:Alpha/Beta hydrolase protein [Roridomyces roridus]|uniref:Carboxylic ester hydrolase n=1 Tax=Roridomyces roridus TaxID=1738132 RepID=A0AAD7BSG9_9AGAR|nr:Alpha/Beta hydrolase protein [Roridomyces roridus]
MHPTRLSAILSLLLASTVAGQWFFDPPPTVTLDNATFTGTSSSQNTDSFLGIPYAQPPVGDLRLRLPVRIANYTGNFSATAYGPWCMQHEMSLAQPISFPTLGVFYVNSTTAVTSAAGTAEDCLTVNVIRPNTATPSSQLPVVFWIYGGGFGIGGATFNGDGQVIVERSIAMGQPVIWVSLNHRLAAYGFLASEEIRAAGVGNLGLQDQREALRWVQRYIGSFGGDPTKVTLWGLSSGAISASFQMLTNGGNNEGLFCAAVMQSGAPLPVGGVEEGQAYYDDMVARTGCTNAPDTLECLRAVPGPEFKAAQDALPGFFAYQGLCGYPFFPHHDGTFLVDNPQALVRQGSVANVPFISSSCDDEGTGFSVDCPNNVTTEADFQKYLKDVCFKKADNSTIAQLAALYPADIPSGSPFNTSYNNALTPQFKRIAALVGDTLFQAPRRFFQNALSGKQIQWTCLSKRVKDTPIVGSNHASDLPIAFGGELTDYVINLATNLDPNGETVPGWPERRAEAPNILVFLDTFLGLGPRTKIDQDTYREDQMKALMALELQYPV